MEKTNILKGKQMASIGISQMQCNIPLKNNDANQEAAVPYETEQPKRDPRKEAYYDERKFKKTSLYVSRNLHRELKTYCAQQDITITEAINKAIALFLSH